MVSEGGVQTIVRRNERTSVDHLSSVVAGFAPIITRPLLKPASGMR